MVTFVKKKKKKMEVVVSKILGVSSMEGVKEVGYFSRSISSMQES
jgi:hypothetical protein